MKVLLKPEIKRFVTEKVKTGQCADASDLVNQALEVLRDQEQFTPKQGAYLRRQVKQGLDQLDRGEFSDFTAETIITQERAKQARRSTSSKRGRR